MNDMKVLLDYKTLTDRELVALTLDEGNEEALLYLIYERYERRLKFITFRYYDSLEFYDDLCNELYIHLKGRNGDWAPLRDFQWRSSFATWLSLVAARLFWKKRSEFIVFEEDLDSISTNGDGELPTPPEEPENEQLVMVMEAINRMGNDDRRFIILKELEGYRHKDIADMLIEKRKRENREAYYRGELVMPDAHYVDANKALAVREIKTLVEQIKEEWYGNK